MELQHLQVKLPVADPEGVNLAEFVPVFHRWVRDQIREELLIDVADYRHLFAGPGVVLVGHQADYAMDCADGRPGLLYRRKDSLEGGNARRLGQAVGSVLSAARLLEDDPTLSPGLTFNRHELGIAVNDRLLAPNTPQTYAAALPDLLAFFGELLGPEQFTLEHQQDRRRLFAVTLRSGRPIAPDSLTGQ